MFLKHYTFWPMASWHALICEQFFFAELEHFSFGKSCTAYNSEIEPQTTKHFMLGFSKTLPFSNENVVIPSGSRISVMFL